MTKCTTGERIIGHKDSEIQRLMNEVSSLKQSLELSQDVRAQLQARLAASSATQPAAVAVEEEAPVPVHQPVQQVVSESSNSNQAILEAIQSLSVQMVGLSNRVDEVEQGRPSSSSHLHSRNDAGASSKPSKELPIRFSRSLRNPFWDDSMMHRLHDPGDDGDGEDGEEELIQDGTPTTEREIVDSRTLQHAKLDPIPSTAADFRSWKNSLILLLGRMDISNSDYLMTWISHAFKVDSAEFCSRSSERVPRLDRWLASELLKGLKGPRFAIQSSGLCRTLHTQRNCSTWSRRVADGFSSFRLGSRQRFFDYVSIDLSSRTEWLFDFRLARFFISGYESVE